MSSYEVEFSDRALDELEDYHFAGNHKLIDKITRIKAQLAKNPRDPGIGQPERLKYKKGKEIWSCQISKKHRMVYEIDGLDVTIKSVWGHYEDK